MLTNTFIHMPGIGAVTEKQLWKADIIDWKDRDDFSSANLGESKISAIKTFADLSNRHLEARNPVFFQDLLPSHQHYRFFPEFRPACAYLDIETTGLTNSARITTIAVWDGNRIQYYVQGQNLSRFPEDIRNYQVLITYNGRSFDIPFIENYFNIKLPHAQIDLRYVLAHLGFKGGLKRCEKKLGIGREDLDGVDGFLAVLLWREYRQNRNQRALETLLAYNIEDVINLETLMIKAYNLNIENTPFSESHRITLPLKPENPFKADRAVIESLRGPRGGIY